MEIMFGQLVNDTTLPVRKRRRPALSCIECRRRKIKCDRNQPCNHCKQARHVNCVYKDLHAVVSTPNRRSLTSSTTTPPQSTTGIDIHSSTDSPAVQRDLFAVDSTYRFPSSLQESGQSSPTNGGVARWEDSERASTSSTVATTLDESPAQVDEQVLVRRTSKRNENLLPDGMAATVDEVEGTTWVKALGLSFSTFNDIIVEDGGAPGLGKIRTKFFNSSDLTPIKELRGSLSKTRFFGQSHWMNTFENFNRICACRAEGAFGNWSDPVVDDANDEVRRILEQCKTMARKIKAERSVKWHMNPDFKDYMPNRELADQLVAHYLRTMESTYRILHIPQFLREYELYWKNPEKAATASAVKILLVMAIGSCFYQEDDSEAVRATAQQWVYSAQAWISAPFEKGRLNLSGLQIHCLLMIARQSTALGGDLLWIAAGSLLRSAFQMGFHRDPKYFPKLSVMHGELRRRLWATVLELTVQTALNLGMPPLIRPGDFDTEPPSNLDDSDIDESAETLPPSKPMHVYTQSAIQVNMLKSFQTRLQITLLLNDIQNEPSYDQVLCLGTSMTQFCNENLFLLSSYPHTLPHPTILQKNLVDMTLRRFVIAIHHPFSVKANSDPRYYYSRKTCVDNAMIIMGYKGVESLNPNTPPPSTTNATGREIMNDFTRLLAVGGGCYKEIPIHASLIVCFELILQLEEERKTGIPPSPTTLASRPQFKQVLEDMMNLIVRRIELGENNVKALLFIEAARGQIAALETGADLERGIVEAARLGAKRCLELLKCRMKSANADVEDVEDAWRGELVDGNSNANGNTQPDPGEFDAGYDFMLHDASPGSEVVWNSGLDVPDSWLFAGWGDNSAF